ncbi:MAG: DEAD/DEAH box helicase, partial [Chitinophagaceae bacterium]
MQIEDILQSFSKKLASCCASILPQQHLHIKNIQGSAFAFNVSANSQWHHTQIVITENFEQAAYLQNELCSIIPKIKSLLLPSSFEEEKTHQKINKTNEILRTETLVFLSKQVSLPKIVIIPIEGLLEKIPDQDAFQKNVISLQTGDTIDLEILIEQLITKNFQWSDFVYEPGQISLRGGILDIFSFAYDKPYRIQLKSDTIHSIRIFDTENQISEKNISRVELSCNMNMLDNATLGKIHCLQFFDNKTPLWIGNFEMVKEKCLYYAKNYNTHTENKPYFELDNTKYTSQFIYTNWQETEKYLSQFTIIETNKKTNFKIDKSIEFNQSLQPVFNRKFDLLLQNLQNLQKQGYTLYLFYDNVAQYHRLLHILEDLGEHLILHPIAFNLHQGFIDHEMKIVCYADHQIFNRYHKYNIKQIQDSEKQLSLKALKELQPGDYITHIDHGVGVFSGLQKIEMDGKIQEAIRILYKNNDILYVNIYSLHKISKYIGKDNTPPTIHKLGSDVWQKLKSKTKHKVKEIAFDLIKLYAQRKAQIGFAHYPDNYMQNELEASFLYEDTPDQNKAVTDVKKDMELSAPMDRLICGDVGFGKTEVAIRASFKAVLSGKQVAVLVPTTILAFQHYQSFSRRLKNFPVTIEFINRFKTTKQKKEIYQQLQDGKIDIIIGTHALLSKDIFFKDLGLLVIDEEQKFGVSHKEKLKILSSCIDTLTLTATPIPRTLQFSLMGARDLSIIQTPPANRKPIYTEVHLFDIEFIRDAILNELQRHGQIYFIHNKVQELYSLKSFIKNSCPEISIQIAHGQMEGSELEKVVLDFITHEYDILLCTNIIESGIDVPNANTIFINNAHYFGLSDLHQLRGRVGRSNKKAFCYLLAPPYSILTNEA